MRETPPSFVAFSPAKPVPLEAVTFCWHLLGVHTSGLGRVLLFRDSGPGANLTGNIEPREQARAGNSPVVQRVTNSYERGKPITVQVNFITEKSFKANV